MSWVNQNLTDFVHCVVDTLSSVMSFLTMIYVAVENWPGLLVASQGHSMFII